ncbi:MAG: group II intron maturase-specific domain-containing protein [Chitinivorax sp.]
MQRKSTPESTATINQTKPNARFRGKTSAPFSPASPTTNSRKHSQGRNPQSGYRFEAGRRTVRRKSMNRLREAIRQSTRRTSGKSIERIIAELNPVLRGWFGYFKHALHGVPSISE